MRRNSDRPACVAKRHWPRLLARTNSTKDRQMFSAPHRIEILLHSPIREDEGGSSVFCKKLLR